MEKAVLELMILPSNLMAIPRFSKIPLLHATSGNNVVANVGMGKLIPHGTSKKCSVGVSKKGKCMADGKAEGYEPKRQWPCKARPELAQYVGWVRR